MATLSKKTQLMLAAGITTAVFIGWLLASDPPQTISPASLSPKESPVAKPSDQLALKQPPVAKPVGKQRVAQRRSLPSAGTQGPAEALLPPENTPGAVFRAEDYSKTRMQIYLEFQRAVLTWTPEIFDQKTQRRGSLTGEEIYQAYVYLRSCLDSLRSVDSFRQRVQALEEHQQRHPVDFPLDELEQVLEGYRTDLARCEGVGIGLNGSFELLLVDWLSLAAERGYPQAQIAYHQSIRWLLTRQRMSVYRDPQAVRRYRERAPVYLQAAVRSGHSEAFVEYSLAMQEGILFAQDDELAFAYARAADLAAHGANDMATTYMAIIEKILSPGKIAAARTRGRELCDLWCR